MRLLFLVLFTQLGCSCSHFEKPLDPHNAVDAKDLTAILSGCGQQLAGSGYLVCRQPEGQTTRTENLVVHTPPNLDCNGDSCTFVRVFFPDGRPALEKSIPKDQSLIEISWYELAGKAIFDIADRGFYSVSVTTHYKHNGEELKTYSDGMVFMHVVRRSYVSLYDSEDDDSFRWTWRTNMNQLIKMTTGSRVFAEKYQKLSMDPREFGP